MSKWISADERLPESFVSVLGCVPGVKGFPAVRECFRVGKDGFFFPALNELYWISRWMPMPEPPRETE